MALPPLDRRPVRDTICLFDVDGTLTPARKAASAEMLELLAQLRQRVAIGFVGGSDLVKQQEQIGVPAGNVAVTSLFDYSFPENGVSGFRLGRALGGSSFIGWLGEARYQALVNWLLRYIADLALPFKRGTFVEFRAGMVNVSPVGRNASAAERDQFERYDRQHAVRAGMVDAARAAFPDYGLTYSVGGQISFDVFPAGWDKTYCLRYLVHPSQLPAGSAAPAPADELPSPTFKTIHFFGDKTFPGGNDWEIYNHPLVTGHTVTGPEDTAAQLRKLFF